MWAPFADGGHDVWIGTDRDGHDWLVKLRGGFRAYRERAFGIMAQHLGISCQSATFLTLAPDSAPLQQTPTAEPIQGAIRFLREHKPGDCGETCPLRDLNAAFEAADDNVAVLRGSSIDHAIDWVRGEMLGYLCDMHEPPGRLFTTAHEFVQVDNELMFTNGSADLRECHWLKRESGAWSEAGIDEALRLCAAVANLPESVLARAAEIPDGFPVEIPWDVPELIRRLPAKAMQASIDLRRVTGT